MATMAAAIVERSMFPSLRFVPLSRVPLGRGITFDVPAVPAGATEDLPQLELVEDAGGHADAGEPADAEPGLEQRGSGDTLAHAVGLNMMIGGAYGFFGRLLRPRIDQLARRSGRFSGMVKILGESCTFGLAYGLAAVSKDAAQSLGGVVARVPVLGSTGIVGKTLQYSLATLVGSKLGEALMVQPEQNEDPVFLANMCVMCNKQFMVGCGQRVAAFSCGHACMCNEAADGLGETCVASYMEQRSDCPLCRKPGVRIIHELRV